MAIIAAVIILAAVSLAIRLAYCRRRDELHDTIQGLCEFHHPE
jgi:hypothetical protein